MNQLQLDAGNTRLKWRLINDGEIISRGFLSNEDDWDKQWSLLFNDQSVESVCISLVSGHERLSLIDALVSKRMGLQLVVARTQKELGGVRIAYDQVGRLGVDRWLVMLAAHNQKPEQTKIVVDCGTAITVDVVGADGIHLGGYIVPGLGLMKESLALSTADIAKVERSALSTVLGRSTEECISQGVLAMAVALINSVQEKHSGSTVFMTGGDRELFIEHLNKGISIISTPDLVMDGLAIAC